MKLLLDTHTFLWLIVGNPNLSATAQVALADTANTLFLSVASVWELAIKTSRRSPQLTLADPLDVFVGKWMAAYQISVLPVQLPHALNVVRLPHHHRDPFDRILIAQALVDGMTLVSGDSEFALYPISVLW